MKRLSNDEVLDARQTLETHTVDMKPTNGLATSAEQNDWTKKPSRWNAPVLNITDARAAAHERIRKENAAKQNQ
jgi:hypothetical protein